MEEVGSCNNKFITIPNKRAKVFSLSRETTTTIISKEEEERFEIEEEEETLFTDKGREMIMKTCPHFNLLPWAKMPAEATVDDEGLLMRLFVNNF